MFPQDVFGPCANTSKILSALFCRWQHRIYSLGWQRMPGPSVELFECAPGGILWNSYFLPKSSHAFSCIGLHSSYGEPLLYLLVLLWIVWWKCGRFAQANNARYLLWQRLLSVLSDRVSYICRFILRYMAVITLSIKSFFVIGLYKGLEKSSKGIK